MNFTDPNTIITFILVIAVLVLAYLVWQLDQKLKKFLIGSTAENLNDSLHTIDSSIRGLEGFKKEIEEYLASVEARLKKARKAFRPSASILLQASTGSGGNQSFATAFVNEQGRRRRHLEPLLPATM
jgi:nitrogen fixation/metabolism regulation signal transduction histidine kinase